LYDTLHLVEENILRVFGICSQFCISMYDILHRSSATHQLCDHLVINSRLVLGFIAALLYYILCTTPKGTQLFAFQAPSRDITPSSTKGGKPGKQPNKTTNRRFPKNFQRRLPQGECESISRTSLQFFPRG